MLGVLMKRKRFTFFIYLFYFSFFLLTGYFILFVLIASVAKILIAECCNVQLFYLKAVYVAVF